MGNEVHRGETRQARPDQVVKVRRILNRLDAASSVSGLDTPLCGVPQGRFISQQQLKKVDNLFVAEGLAVKLLCVLVCLTFGGMSGFAAPATAQSPESPKLRFVDAITLNLRATPSAEAEILTTLPRGHLVIQLAEEGDWARVSAYKPGTKHLVDGWVATRFLVATPVAAPPHRQTPSVSRDDGLQIIDARMDCSQSYIDEGLKDCTIQIDLSLQGPSWVQMNASVSCNADVRVTDVSGWARNETGNGWATLYVNSGYGSTTMIIEIDVSRYVGEPTAHVKLADLSCSIT